MKPSNPDAGLPTADDVRGIIPRSTPADELIEKVTDELLAHGEFSASGNNRPNARIAAKAVIDIVRATSQTPDAVIEALEKIAGIREYTREDYEAAARYKSGEGIWSVDEYLADRALLQSPATDGPAK